MRKIKLALFIGILLLFSTKTAKSQFILTVMVDTIPTDTVHRCINKILDLNSVGSANFLMNNGFNNLDLGVGWSSTAANPVFTNPCQCVSTTNCATGCSGAVGPNGAFAWVGTTNSVARTLVTQSYNLNTFQLMGGCKVKWWMMYGKCPDQGTCENPDEPAEGVHLQYTIDGFIWTDFPGPNINPIGNTSVAGPFITTTNGSGGFWTPVTDGQQFSHPLYHWNLFQSNIPSIAYTNNTKFRFAQLQSSTQGWDAWGIDEVEITCPTNPYFEWKCLEIPSWSYSGINPPPFVCTQAGTFHYVATLVDLNTGNFISDTIVAIVHNPSLDINAGTSNLALCLGDSTILYSNGFGLSNYNWNTTPIVYNDSVVVSPIVSTTYVLTAQDMYNCIIHDTISVIVNPKPVITITNGSACEGDTAILSASGGYYYQWSNGDTTASIAVGITTTTTYQVTVTTLLGCSDTASATASINPKPIIQLTDNTTICIGDNATLTAGGGTIYLWSTGATTPSISVNPTSLTSYTVAVTDANGCFDSKSVDVDVITLPVPMITQEVDTICKGTSTTLTASGGTTYLWTTGETASSILISPYVTSVYSVTASNSLNNVVCSANASTQMNVRNCNMIYIPNSFSPYGYNTVFKPLGEIKSAKNYSFQIFNRWGQLIYETNDPEQGWDGKLNGEYVPHGAYIYYLNFDNVDEKYEKVGTVNILL